MPKFALAVLAVVSLVATGSFCFGQSVHASSNPVVSGSVASSPSPDQGGGVGSVGGYEVAPRNTPSGGSKNKGLRPPNP